MRRAASAVLVLAAAAGVAAAQGGAKATSTSLPLQRVAVELPSLDVAQLVLHAAPVPGQFKGPFPTQKLRLGDVEIPTFTPARVTASADSTAIAIEVQLRAVPEQVLGLPIDRLPVTWEGTSEDGLERVTVEGAVTPTDPGSVNVPVRTLYERYSKIADVRVSTDAGEVIVRVLTSLYNPFSFDLTATRLTYKVAAGDRQIVAGDRRGFRLRSRRWSDVVIEQAVAPGDAAAGGLAALLSPSSVRIEGSMSIRTPTGDRAVDIRLGS
jgi:hypothetical protein